MKPEIKALLNELSTNYECADYCGNPGVECSPCEARRILKAEEKEKTTHRTLAKRKAPAKKPGPKARQWTARGQTMSAPEWAQALGMSVAGVQGRLRKYGSPYEPTQKQQKLAREKAKAVRFLKKHNVKW